MDEGYISKIEKEIASLDLKGKKHYYIFSESFGGNGKQQVKRIKDHFESFGYVLEIHECKQCSRAKWDIIISWK